MNALETIEAAAQAATANALEADELAVEQRARRQFRELGVQPRESVVVSASSPGEDPHSVRVDVGETTEPVVLGFEHPSITRGTLLRLARTLRTPRWRSLIQNKALGAEVDLRRHPGLLHPP
jgi:Fe2+ transport system protein FeoA